MSKRNNTHYDMIIEGNTLFDDIELIKNQKAGMRVNTHKWNSLAGVYS